MEKDSLVSYDIEISTQNQERKYYALTEKVKTSIYQIEIIT